MEGKYIIRKNEVEKKSEIPGDKSCLELKVSRGQKKKLKAKQRKVQKQNEVENKNDAVVSNEDTKIRSENLENLETTGDESRENQFVNFNDMNMKLQNLEIQNCSAYQNDQHLNSEMEVLRKENNNIQQEFNLFRYQSKIREKDQDLIIKSFQYQLDEIKREQQQSFVEEKEEENKLNRELQNLETQNRSNYEKNQNLNFEIEILKREKNNIQQEFDKFKCQSKIREKDQDLIIRSLQYQLDEFKREQQQSVFEEREKEKN